METTANIITEFQEYLKAQTTVRPNKQPFFIKWVDMYMSTIKAPHDIVDNQNKTRFIESLSNQDRYADWQVNQAIDAIELFNQVFLPENHPEWISTELSSTVTQNWAQAQQQMREVCRLRHYSPSTEASYLYWVVQFAKYMGNRTPSTVDANHVRRFLSHLAIDRNVSASTQNQAFNALLFLFTHILKKDYGDLRNTVRAKIKRRLPTVLTRNEVERLLGNMEGIELLISQVIYGSGLRLMECMDLRVKDIDFEYNQIIVRDGKGQKDRVTTLANSVKEPIKRHMEKVKAIHESDLKEGFGRVNLPFALARKYPNANREWGWQFVFPASKKSKDPRSGNIYRHHLHESALQRTVKAAIRSAGITKHGN